MSGEAVSGGAESGGAEQQARVQVEGTAVEGVVVVRTPVFGDARGFFSELFHADAFAAVGLPSAFVQDNHSRSGALAWDSPALAIDWPLPPGVAPVLSPRDAAAPAWTPEASLP